ncbi:TolB family protein [candidate division KSB1 bacterium]
MKIKSFFITILFFTTILILNCSKSTTSAQNNDDFPEITGQYLGQEPPGTTPVRFPPGVLLANNTWFWHGPLAFSPDGRELHFAKYIRSSDDIRLYFMKIENGRWTEPQTVPFNSEYDGNNPLFSPDGNKLYYISNRTEKYIFEVTKDGNNWSVPRRIDIPVPGNKSLGWQFSIVNNGTIFFELWENNHPDIYFSTFDNGLYSTPENIGTSINTSLGEFALFVAPDEDYIIFTSNRDGGYGRSDLYISFRMPDNTWGDPVNMGPDINSAIDEAAPYITPDGNYLFYFTERPGDNGYNPYWVSTQIIEDLKPAELK